jgi:anti-anti-sigma factor
MSTPVRVTQLGRVAVVRYQGELDLAAAPTMSSVLSEFAEASAPVHHGGPAAVVVDLTEVTFLDCTALGVLVRLARRCALQNRVFAFCGAGGVVGRLFTVLELDRQFLVTATVEEAIHSAVPASDPDCVNPTLRSTDAGRPSCNT